MKIANKNRGTFIRVQKKHKFIFINILQNIQFVIK